MAADHLLSLKVMRISQPELASAWQPFYSSSPSFSAHSSAAILSLQGPSPLPSHPKTFRDLTHVSEFLTLPSSFGSIQLGETFSSCLCVNNEAEADVEVTQVKVEVQTVTTKITLSDLESSRVLLLGDTLESVVHHEVKELGQHVLACTVTYRPPPNPRVVAATTGNTSDSSLQTFRKFYKFAVTNPLSVKTKVHTPRSPSALMSAKERDKVFLEVHIQNLTQQCMCFERINFQSADGWEAKNVNSLKDNGTSSGFTAILQPQDMRQYIFILAPAAINLSPPVLTPGSIIPLGRLDISWRSSFGEPGRLLTSVLSRRIPLPLTSQPASSLPPYLKRTIANANPSRPQSPQSFQSRPSSPLTNYRPESPFQNTSSAITPIIRPQSPIQAIPPSSGSDLEVNLIVNHIPRGPISIEKPFNIAFTLTIFSSTPLKYQQRRRIKVAVQHVRLTPQIAAPAFSAFPDVLSSHLPSGLSTPSSMTQMLDASAQSPDVESRYSTKVGEKHANNVTISSLPPPRYEGPDKIKSQSSGGIYVGSSILFLPSMELSMSSDSHQLPRNSEIFELTFVAAENGFVVIGGVRVLLIEDKLIHATGIEDSSMEEVPSKSFRTQVLKEYDVVCELWVAS